MRVCELSFVQKEDEMQILVMKNAYLQSGRFFPKVTRIAGNIIAPEIDLLYISELKDEKILTAYELKLLKSKKNATNYRHIYEGIGQAIMYFKYGIDFSYLLLGISKNVFVSETFIGEMIHHVSDLMKEHFRSFGIMIWRERNPAHVETYLKPEGTFYCGFSEEYALCRKNLLSGNFVYSRSFLDRLNTSE